MSIYNIFRYWFRSKTKNKIKYES